LYEKDLIESSNNPILEAVAFELIKEKITAVRKNDTHYREDKTGR